MKKFTTIIILLICTYSLIAQAGPERNKRHFSKRFEELEKIKLLENLDLDEETTLKFFSRRNQSKNKLEKLMEEKEQLFNEMEEMLNKEEKDSDYGLFIEQLFKLEMKMMNEKSAFINSLDDILTKKEILKVILFEQNFRKDIRDLLIEKGRKKYSKDRMKN